MWHEISRSRPIKTGKTTQEHAEVDLGTGSSAPDPGDRPLERALGNQIRLIRRQQDLSISDLAGSAGISNGMLSKIENGAISASLTTLQAISSVLQVPLSSLFASFEERQDCSYVPAGQGVQIDRRGTKVGHMYNLLGAVLRGEVVVEPYSRAASCRRTPPPLAAPPAAARTGWRCRSRARTTFCTPTGT